MRRFATPRTIMIGAALLAALVIVGLVAAITAAPSAPAPDKAAAEYIDPRLLVADPAGHIGRNMRLTGQVITVDQKVAEVSPYTQLLVSAEVRDRPVTELLIVDVRPINLTLLRDRCYAFYAIVSGTRDTLVSVTAYAVEKAEQETLGCAKP